MTQEEWIAIRDNDRSYDGRFFYGVKTTKKICRPSCPARTCNPKNVVIFRSYEEGVAAGFTACKRCHPDQPDWKGARQELSDAARRLVDENYREKFSLQAIADRLFVNENYLLRTFKEITGYTLLEYHNYVRCNHSKELLADEKLTIAYISDTVGYATQAHYTRVFKKYFSCTPGEYRRQLKAMLEVDTCTDAVGDFGQPSLTSALN